MGEVVGDGGYTCTVHGICVNGVHLRTKALAEVTYILNGIMVFEALRMAVSEAIQRGAQNTN